MTMNAGRGTMQCLKRTAVLALPLAAAVSLGIPASAAPGTQAAPSAQARVQMARAGDTARASGVGSAISPQALVSYISNEAATGLGVSRTNTSAPYEATLPGHRRTDGSPLYWSQAVSFYVGAGSCVDAWYFQDSAWRWNPLDSFRGPAEVATQQVIPGESVARWAIRNTRAC